MVACRGKLVFLPAGHHYMFSTGGHPKEHFIILSCIYGHVSTVPCRGIQTWWAPGGNGPPAFFESTTVESHFSTDQIVSLQTIPKTGRV